MPDTVSIRMATRWLSCSLLLAVAACGARQVYTAPQTEDRIDENELRTQADAAVRVNCPRLQGKAIAVNGDATYTLSIAADGRVQSAKLNSSFGDQMLDDTIGRLLARTNFESAQQKAGSLRVNAGYACGPMAKVATFDFLERS